MKTVAVCTFARSEYGLLKRVVKLLSEKAIVKLIVGGAHFNTDTGYSFQEIIEDGAAQYAQILKAPFPFAEADGTSASKSVASGTELITTLLAHYKVDAVVIMGDRYELFTATVPALLLGIPIIHISGGEITEGAIDDSIRHATTKLAHLHLVANTECAENVSRMGEEDWRIVITGEPGLDNIHHAAVATESDLTTRFGLSHTTPTILVTCHPSTLEPDLSITEQCTPLAQALEELTEYQIVITAPGADPGSEHVVRVFSSLASSNTHIRYIPHLGSKYYLALLKKSAVVVGNSSSGLVEAPSVRTPSVNIGNRQKNRMAAKSVLNCGYQKVEILETIRAAVSSEHKSLTEAAHNPYDPYCDGNNSERAVKAIIAFLNQPKEKMLVKKFTLETENHQWSKLLK